MFFAGTPAFCAANLMPVAGVVLVVGIWLFRTLGCGMQVRKAQDIDVSRLLILEAGCFSARSYRDHCLTSRQFRYYLRQPESILRIALVAGEPAGYVLAKLRRRGMTYWLDLVSIGVLAAYRGCGVGRRLLLAAQQEARRRRASCMRLEVYERNHRALRLFQAFGFTAGRQLLDYYGPNLHARRLTKRLDANRHARLRATPSVH